METVNLEVGGVVSFSADSRHVNGQETLEKMAVALEYLWLFFSVKGASTRLCIKNRFVRSQRRLPSPIAVFTSHLIFFPLQLMSLTDFLSVAEAHGYRSIWSQHEKKTFQMSIYSEENTLPGSAVVLVASLYRDDVMYIISVCHQGVILTPMQYMPITENAEFVKCCIWSATSYFRTCKSHNYLYVILSLLYPK